MNKKGLALAIVLILFTSVFAYPAQYADADDVIIKEECTSEGWLVTIIDPEGNPLENVRVMTLEKMRSSNPEESFYTDEMGMALVPFSSITGFVKLAKPGYNDHKLFTSCEPPIGYKKIESGFIRYTDPSSGITIDHPADWIVDRSDPNFQFVLISPLESNVDQYRESVSIMIQNVGFTNPVDFALIIAG